VETFDTLREQLALLDWPDVYFFKFIVPNDELKIAQITAFFDENATIGFHPSGKGNYISISIKTVMLNVDEIISIYEQTSAINGVISL
jgi:putative lipoic acid-binding regulatory protein